jgi:type IV pilus assembly protein PilB
VFDGSAVIQQSIVAMLYSANDIDIARLEHLVGQAEEQDKNPLTLMLNTGFIDEKFVADLLADVYGIEPSNWSGTIDDQSLYDLLPFDYMVSHNLVPLRKEGNALVIALAEPMALSEVGNIRAMTGMQIDTRVITYSDLQKALDFYKLGAEAANASSGAGDANAGSGDIQSKTRRQVSRSNEDGEQSDVVEFVNRILADAAKMRVSDIHIEPYKDKAVLRYRVDGVLRKVETGSFLHDHYPAVTTRLKIMASLDIAERRLPQDGAIYYNFSGREVDIRVSVLPVQNGERVVMRLLDRSAVRLSLDTLRLNEKTHKALVKAIEAPQGMVLVTGPTGSGKSTTLYSCVNHINREGINILTVEDPVEYNIDGIGQVQVNETIGRTFATALRSFLRQDPEVILVGEIRDQATAEISIKASLTGHLVLSTLHTNSALDTINRLIDMGIPAYLLTSSLSLIVAQRLARKPCDECSEPDPRVTPELLLGFGATEDQAAAATPKLSRGCSKCSKTGYIGRQGIYEVLTISNALRDALLRSAGGGEMQDIVESEGFESLQVIGLRMLCEGRLTLDEYQRVLSV